MDRMDLVMVYLETHLFLTATLPLFVYAASILEGPSNATVLQGETIILTCKVDGVDDSVGQHQAVTWETGNPKSFISHDRRIVREEKMSRYSIVGNATNGENNLQIMPVLAEDNGEYSCSVFRSFAEGAVSAFVTVLYPPPDNYPVCFPVENKLQFTEIETLAVVCKTGISDPPADVIWIDGNGQEINNTSIMLIGKEYVVSHKEVIYNYHDGAILTCSVSHPLWSAARNCTLGPLFILYHPITTISVQITNFEVILKCLATGNPSEFTYKWRVFLGNQSAPRVDFKQQDITSNTDILILQRTDYYGVELVVECAARNSQGVGRTNATILLSSSHCAAGKTKIIDICRTISVPTICVLVIVLFLSCLAIALLIVRLRRLKKMATSEVSNVSSRVEMKRKGGSNGVYITLTESIENLERT